MCNGAMSFKVGEIEYVGGKVRPAVPKEVVVVTDSGYEVYEGDILIDSGKCEINGDAIRFLFEAKKAGVFVVKMFACVGKEKTIDSFTLVVEE